MDDEDAADISELDFQEIFNESRPGYPRVSKEVHYIMGTVLAVVGVAGLLGNIVVLFVFTRFRRLRGPFSCFIVNLAFADLGTSVLHVMAVISCFKERWAFGQLGCMVYAAGVGHFGLLSIVTLSAIAVERYMVITAKPISGQWKITERGSRKVCLLAWSYCFALSLPPLFGWSRYIPEGFFTSCSWDYSSRTAANRAFYIYLLIFGFILPVTIITYCYTFILMAIFEHGKEMTSIKTHEGGRKKMSSTVSTAAPVSSTIRTAEIILVLVVLFMISWTPYAIVTLIGQFGNKGVITPWLSALPAFFAKASVVYNPIVYGLSHPHFRASLRQYFASGSPESLARAQSSLRVSHSNRHHTHFRCFHMGDGSKRYYSEPDNRSIVQSYRSNPPYWKSTQRNVSTTLCNSRSSLQGGNGEVMVVTTSSQTPLCTFYESPVLSKTCRLEQITSS
ncbi:hypothetical protein LSTR_LSTR014303 [Laodelphax striatellus]|uniref:G-protein coupled receptors family 1 profile domain-containing protein n=1 Tax=Laodelphax striatellus TaxID=195883 RepID=A0A482XMQ1_LAOST|nr:hypothetical protein LSTR_LSTR014303 [Laodelphax striatellus]